MDICGRPEGRLQPGRRPRPPLPLPPLSPSLSPSLRPEGNVSTQQQSLKVTFQSDISKRVAVVCFFKAGTGCELPVLFVLLVFINPFFRNHLLTEIQTNTIKQVGSRRTHSKLFEAFIQICIFFFHCADHRGCVCGSAIAPPPNTHLTFLCRGRGNNNNNLQLREKSHKCFVKASTLRFHTKNAKMSQSSNFAAAALCQWSFVLKVACNLQIGPFKIKADIFSHIFW